MKKTETAKSSTRVPTAAPMLICKLSDTDAEFDSNICKYSHVRT